MPMAYCQITIHFDCDVLLKFSNVNTSLIVFYAGLTIPIEKGKILE